MPYRSPLSKFVFLLVCLFSLSCNKENPVQLIDKSLKNLELSTGVANNVITIHAQYWQVEFVKEASTGTLLLDKAGNPMQLTDNDQTEHDGDLINLKKTDDGQGLSLSLQENFSDNPRTFLIGLVENGNRDVISITQRRAKGYKIVDQQFTALEETQKVYTNSEDCLPLTLSNTDPEEKYMKTNDIFKNVYYSSKFVSDDYGAFDWFSQDVPLISIPDLLVDEAVVWSGRVPFQQGETKEAYIGEGKSSESLLVQPHTNIDLEGTITYVERSLKFTWTIQNEESGHRFTVTGLLHQKVPVSPTTIIKRLY